VYNAQTGEVKWSVNSGGGASIAVGNVDSDAAPEIVTTTYGGKGYVLNGLTGAVKWSYINSFGAKVRLADLDGDGKQEIICASSWAKITIFDAALQSPVWEIPTSQDIGAVTIADADGDGIPEIIYGDGQWGKVHAVDVRTHAERWAVSNPEHGVSGIAMADVDADGKKELLWGAGGSSTGPDFLYIADPQTAKIKWQNLDFSGLSALAVGDVDDDGEDEIVMVTSYSNSGYDEGIIHIFNARTHALKFQQKLGTRDWSGNNRAIRIGDVDGDGHTEFVITSSDLYNGVIMVYDGATCTLKRQSTTYSNISFNVLAIGDVDNDGKIEIVTALTGGGQGVHLVIFDGTTMKEKWATVDLSVSGSSVYDIKLANLDKDGHPDIIVSMSDKRLIVFDGVTRFLKQMIDSPARAVEVADVDGDGFPEVLVGRNDGTIDVYDGVTFAIKKNVPTFGTTAVDALRVADLDGNGTKEWLIASNGVLSVLDGQGLKWRSSYLGSNLGRNNSIAVKDIDSDGRQEIFIGTDPVLYEFK
ncbi:MAG TPA: FG-GAP-like repeat-containing protein, partial [Dongiaceae bacterium]|nr:FG-GAP-like repeat-containing protein [Dongiaceae bacterium]